LGADAIDDTQLLVRRMMPSRLTGLRRSTQPESLRHVTKL
jgi:hypothetical protein